VIEFSRYDALFTTPTIFLCVFGGAPALTSFAIYQSPTLVGQRKRLGPTATPNAAETRTSRQTPFSLRSCIILNSH
jgi:hypothetical protein